MKHTLSLLVVLFITSAAFAQQPKKDKSAEPLKYGAEVNTANAVTADDLLMIPRENEDPQYVTVKGKVTSVCQVKGCWLKLETTSGAPIHVTFKDYAFFVPKDLAGKEVVMQGKVWVNVTPVSELRHYAEDDGKSKAEINKITQPKKEVRYEASGVTVL